jgi:hypothetical protein
MIALRGRSVNPTFRLRVRACGIRRQLGVIMGAQGDRRALSGRSLWFLRRRVELAGHRFEVGENVYYTSGMAGRFGARGLFQVVRQLPWEGDEFQYRIKRQGEPYERVAKESQLDQEAEAGA